jgi:hypothetical protein
LEVAVQLLDVLWLQAASDLAGQAEACAEPTCTGFSRSVDVGA